MVHHHSCVNTLDALEEVKHLVFADPTISIGVALVDGYPDFLVVLGRSHSHRQAEVPVGVEKLLSLQLPSSITVISHEDIVDVVL